MTLNYWQKAKRPVSVNARRLAALTVAGCALLLVPSCVYAGPYADVEARLQGRPEAEAVKELGRLAGSDADARAALRRGGKGARAYIALRATLEGAPRAKVPSIPAGPGDDRVESSWLARALAKLKWPESKRSQSGMPPLAVGAWVAPIVWTILFLVLGFAVYLLLRTIKFTGRTPKASLVDADEPLRSADEWLEEANGLIARGEYRQAVRGLYVAGLLRFDEVGVARFDRNQTNWEHLRRIEASPKHPADSDVRGATSLFDRCWYGHLPAKPADAETMRSWYDTLVRRLGEVPQ